MVMAPCVLLRFGWCRAVALRKVTWAALPPLPDELLDDRDPLHRRPNPRVDRSGVAGSPNSPRRKFRRTQVDVRRPRRRRARCEAIRAIGYSRGSHLRNVLA